MHRAKRLSIVRQFAKFASTLDHRTEVPPEKLLPGRPRRATPYLYHGDDVCRLVEAAHQIDPADKFKGVAYATMFGFLAVTGMRIGEALSLDREDVDLKRGLVTVRRAKGNKSRLVPLHLSTQKALQKYANLRDGRFPRPLSSGFFVSERGTRQYHNTVRRWFRLVSCQIGLRKPGDRRGPRVHDLRHRFAIQTMLHWYRTKTDVDVHLPDLTTYLGHGHVKDTYWYLSAVPELLKLATLRLQPKEVA
jgi:integrase